MKTINYLRSKLFALTLALVASVSTFAYDYHGDLLCYNVLTDSSTIYLCTVLRGYNDGINSGRLTVNIFNCNLSLTVGTKVGKLT